jgi:uncharacterized protein with beta-barrel porin domain
MCGPTGPFPFHGAAKSSRPDRDGGKEAASLASLVALRGDTAIAFQLSDCAPRKPAPAVCIVGMAIRWGGVGARGQRGALARCPWETRMSRCYGGPAASPAGRKIFVATRGLGAVAAAGLLLSALLTATMPALADGGAGGTAGGNPAGSGGAGDNGTAGSATFGPGGAGGGGAGGGNGGTASTGFFPTPGGAGGTAIAPNGRAGSNGTVGGGGGGGGYNGNGSGGATISNTTALSGGDGGRGGDGFNGGGGGGGAGGDGAIVTGSGANANSGAISGGNGGNGGDNTNCCEPNGGNGGDGGVGVQFATGNATLTNSASISGGNGGQRGTSAAGSAQNGTNGAGGVGIIGANLTVITSGSISGGLAGDGVTRANAITFTGGTSTLQLQPGYRITGNVVGTGNDAFRLGGSGTGSFNLSLFGGSQQYQGFATFGIVGGSWTLTGMNASPIPFTVNSGTLEMDGSLNASSMSVGSGGMLSGTGNVDPITTTIMSGGTLAPGNAANPTGTLTITGNLAFQSGAVYLVQVTPTGAASTNVTGSAALNGTVNAVFASGSYVSKKYTILTTTGGLGGTAFSSLANAGLPAGFTDGLGYDTNNAYLNLTAVLGSGPSSLPMGGLNANHKNIANALNTFFNNGGTLSPNFVTIFGLTGNNLTNALNQIDGEEATDARKGAFQLMSDFLNLMLDPLSGGGGGIGGGGTSGGASGFAPEHDATLPPEIVKAYNAMLTKAPPKPQYFDQRWTSWGSAFGGTSHTNGDPTIGSNDVNASDYGFAGGADYHMSKDTVLGFAMAGGGTNWNLAQGLGSGRSDAFQAGVYAKTNSGPTYLSAALAFSNNWFTTNRIAGLGDQLQAKFQGQSYGGRIEAGYRYGLPSTNYLIGFTPYAAVQAHSFHTPSYSETDLTGGGFGLNYAEMNATDTRTELGARADDLTMLGTMPLILRGRLAWAHDWITNAALTAAFQVLPGTNFVVNGAAPPKDSALTTLGAELRMTTNWFLLGKFDGQFGSGSQTYAGTGTLRYTW